MTLQQDTNAPMRNLVVVMIGLAVLGAAIAGIHWIVIDNPQQQAITAPENSVTFPPSCMGSQSNCFAWCHANQFTTVGHTKCMNWCRSQC